MHSSVRNDDEEDNDGDLNNNENDKDDNKNDNTDDVIVSTRFVQTKSATLIKDSNIVFGFGWQLSVSTRKYAAYDFVCKQKTSSLVHTSLVLNRNYLLLSSTRSEWRQS